MSNQASNGTKLPITVITGFLGAGKTTLVNWILNKEHGRKIAVIENEFGEIGIDDALVVESREQIFEMNNGCVCCTVRGDLILTLNKLLKRKKKLDAILIETTGLANPAPVIQTFFVDDDIREATVLDAVLTVVDTKHIMQHLDEEKPEDVVNEALQQVAFADKILLNKLDLVTEEEKQAVQKRIHAINPSVQVLETINSEVDIDKIIGVGAFSLAHILDNDPDFLPCDEAAHSHAHDSEREHHHDHKCDASCSHDHDHDASHASHGHHDDHHHDHKHDSAVSSVGLELHGECDLEKLQSWLGQLLQEHGQNIFRSKGILAARGSDARFVFQGVHMMCQFRSSEVEGCRPWKDDEKRFCKVVFIGKHLDRAALTEGLTACMAT